MAPFHVTRIFEDKDDVLWAWNLIFKEICDKHAPCRKIKIRSQSAPWITSEIRRKMNFRYKRFKDAVTTKDQSIWARYKRVRNEVTADLRRAKAIFIATKFVLLSHQQTTGKCFLMQPNRKTNQRLDP